MERDIRIFPLEPIELIFSFFRENVPKADAEKLQAALTEFGAEVAME